MSRRRESIPEIPPLTTVQRWRERARMAPRRLTAGLRELPDLLILGAQRAGTTSLQDHLALHPAIHMARPKEVHFFDLHFERGERWYRAHFPTHAARRRLARSVGGRAVLGEATPYYAFHPLAPQRAAALVPDAKLLFLARDPVERAISHYHHEVRWGFEDAPTFAEALEREEERLAGAEAALSDGTLRFSHAHNHFSYFARGLYARQLAAWLEHFPRERLQILGSERLFSEPGATLSRVLRFLELPERDLGAFPRLNALARPDAGRDLRRMLRERYRPHDEALYELAGEDFGWGERE